jgi:hypothetical protein
MNVSKSVVLKLYRDLFKFSEKLKYTDKTYYRQYIRKEFEKNNTSVELALKVSKFYFLSIHYNFCFSK